MRLRTAILAWVVPVVAVVGLATPASASTANTEHFLAVATSPSGPTRVFADGPITATGFDRATSTTRDIFTFPRGTLIVRHHAVVSHSSFDPKLCLARHTESGTYSVVGGSGAYQDASGSGLYHVMVIAQGCNRKVPPKTFVLTIKAQGPLSL
jgi:hypothetical protein